DKRMRPQQQRHGSSDGDRHEVLLDIIRRAPGGLQRRRGGGEGDVVEQERVAVGGCLATWSAPSDPPAPPTFSTTTLWLKPSHMPSATSRARMPLLAPA